MLAITSSSCFAFLSLFIDSLSSQPFKKVEDDTNHHYTDLNCWGVPSIHQPIAWPLPLNSLPKAPP